jgi:hypothetical protein
MEKTVTKGGKRDPPDHFRYPIRSANPFSGAVPFVPARGIECGSEMSLPEHRPVF